MQSLPQRAAVLSSAEAKLKESDLGYVRGSCAAAGSDSGLLKGIALLKEIKGITTIFFSNDDIVRHPLVGKIVKAFDRKKKADSE